MKTMNKTVITFLIGAMALVGGASIASARGGWHQGGGYDCGFNAPNMTPELQERMFKNRNDMAPAHLELKAKRQELQAKIYSGASDSEIQNLRNQITALQNKLMDNHIAMHKELAKAGVPMPMRGNCGYGPGFHGKGPKGHGKHGDKGFHRGGPGWGNHGGQVPPAPADAE